MPDFIVKEQHTGQELGVLVISIQDNDGEIGAGVIVLYRVHFLTNKRKIRTKLSSNKSD